MRIVFLGSGAFGLDCLDALDASGHDLNFIVTQPAHRAGRGQVPRPTDVAKWAKQRSIPFLETPDVNSDHLIDEIAYHKPDLIVVIAFGQKISNKLIAVAPKGAINVHSSVLPKYRGAAPINWAIINGEKETGVSIITLAEKMDAGEILGTVSTEIGATETAGELHDRLAKLSVPLLLETIGKIDAGTATFQSQDEDQVTIARKLKKSDGYIDFSNSAEAIERKIRGMWPWPEASAEYVNKITGKCKRVIIAEAEVVDGPAVRSKAAGMLDENLNITCGEGKLRIIKIKPAGGSLMDFKAFVNGFRCQEGDAFMKIEKK